jgi:multiple sugar transport system substrate-binding protein
VAKFYAETHIKVDISVVTWSDILEKLTIAIASGTGPDVSASGNTWNGDWADSKGVMSWTPQMINEIGGIKQFVPAVVPTMGFPGQEPISIPDGAATWLMLYNKSILAKAGVTTIPTTWAQFVADAQKVTDPAKGIWGVSSDVANVSDMTTWDYLLLRQYGGNYFANNAPSAKATVDTPAAVQSVQFFANWIGKYKIMAPQDAEYTENQAEEDFDNGKVGFVFVQGSVATTLPSSQYGAALLPLPSTNLPASERVMSHVAGENVIILKSTKHLAADIQWVKFLLSPWANTQKNLFDGQVPATYGPAKSPQFSADKVDSVMVKILDNYAQPFQINNDDGGLADGYARAVGQLLGQAATGGTVTTADVQSALNTVEQAALAREAHL